MVCPINSRNIFVTTEILLKLSDQLADSNSKAKLKVRERRKRKSKHQIKIKRERKCDKVSCSRRETSSIAINQRK